MQHPPCARIRLPAFWPDQVQLWFSACESQFAAYGIHNQHARYSCVLALLRPEDSCRLSDLILNPDPKRPYDRLKATLIERSQTPQWRNDRDETPSAILNRIRLAMYEKSMEADETALKEMLIPFLPTMVRTILEPVKETASVDQLVQMADRVLAIKSEQQAMEASFGDMVSRHHLQQQNYIQSQNFNQPQAQQPQHNFHQQSRQGWRQRSGRFRRRSVSRRPRAASQCPIRCDHYQSRFEESIIN
ncbi:unnamed protein product [Hymenolepis diminuta]|uniref:DUF7041 domain-containing protein n=1 Tax=Hymenolepis diminuta TaxID=6216 RepID=A0A0R3SUC4_HYMDI|nr:unnamed protein product [Hymenolepis diminuta]VUZ39000.1 unnamed protein product [Hymenolepis diminuta]